MLNENNQKTNDSKNKNITKQEKKNNDFLVSPKIYELSFYEPFYEMVNLLDGEGNSYLVAVIRNEFEINMTFNKIYKSLNDFIFIKDFFSFPQYIIYEVKYNQDSKTEVSKFNQIMKSFTKKYLLILKVASIFINMLFYTR